MRRVLVSLAVAAGVGLGLAVALAIAYAIVKIYLSGHSLEPAWFDSVASSIWGILVLGGGAAAFLLTWRSLPPRGAGRSKG